MFWVRSDSKTSFRLIGRVPAQVGAMVFCDMRMQWQRRGLPMSMAALYIALLLMALALAHLGSEVNAELDGSGVDIPPMQIPLTIRAAALQLVPAWVVIWAWVRSKERHG